MNVKTLTQVFLIFITISITLFFFYKYFYQKSDPLEIVEQKSFDEQILIEEKVENIIKDLTFENIDTNGNKFRIESKYGEFTSDDENTVKLTDVKAKIDIKGKDSIFIASKKAIYNKLSLKTKFYIDVNINYQENIIESDNFKIDLSKNNASINGNVIFNNNNIESYADNIDFNLVEENITINMFDNEDNIKIKRK